jgi:hypothetical protein
LESPGGLRNLLDEKGFLRVARIPVAEEVVAELLVMREMFVLANCACGVETMTGRIPGGTILAGLGLGSSALLSVRSVCCGLFVRRHD